MNLDSCGSALDLAEVIRREFDVGRADVLLQTVPLRGTWWYLVVPGIGTIHGF